MKLLLILIVIQSLIILNKSEQLIFNPTDYYGEKLINIPNNYLIRIASISIEGIIFDYNVTMVHPLDTTNCTFSVYLINYENERLMRDGKSFNYINGGTAKNITAAKFKDIIIYTKFVDNNIYIKSYCDKPITIEYKWHYRYTTFSEIFWKYFENPLLEYEMTVIMFLSVWFIYIMTFLLKLTFILSIFPVIPTILIINKRYKTLFSYLIPLCIILFGTSVALLPALGAVLVVICFAIGYWEGIA